ncbi:MAG: NAD-dependent malic enzyme [Candidatus Wallbacteria bacterium]|nr:NAD-dependent malic enzyme [Candidatus Wallbacteria bacterium]
MRNVNEFHIRSDVRTQQRYLAVSAKGVHLKDHPLLNKGTAFSAEEREQLGLLGILPPKISNIDEQLARVREAYSQKGTNLERFVYLVALQDRNETLFYRFMLENIEELLPIVYTPVVGEACQKYSHIYRRGRGIWITPEHADRIDAILENVPQEDVRVIVVTDSERILGLGDQGAGGMGIPIGKLTIYTAAAGIYTGQTLPVCLDVGTDNTALLADPMYLGWRKPRLRGPAYDELIEKFVAAVKKRWPGVLLQWEDFANTNAFRLLAQYQEAICSFNDDIQGTGAVALSGMIAAIRSKKERMSDQKVVFFGAGEAASGIAEQCVTLMKAEGTSESDARRRIWFVDSKGLVLAGGRPLPDHKKPYARDNGEVASWKVVNPATITLLETVQHVHPTILVGTSGTPGTFTEPIIHSMARHCTQPVILPLSNPTSKTECAPAHALEWSEGRALVATGSPFPSVDYNGRKVRIGQANNAFIFPGVGLAIVATKAKKVTQGMFRAAASALADAVTPRDLSEGSLYPSVSRIREVARKVAIEVARHVFEEKLAGVPDSKDVVKLIDASIWFPEYLPYRYEPRG